MKLPAILASDLHLTANPADAYRWGLFPWLVGELLAEKAKTLILLGDLTDAKDYHPAELVNRVVAEFKKLLQAVPGLRVIILMGNHDYLKAGNMFFEFLSALPGVEVITRPTEDLLSGEAAMFLPYSKTPAKDWAGWDFSHYQYLFLHQTVKGAVASNGQKMEGELLPEFNAGKVYSGDIHVPQRIGKVEYVGSPYHVHFGDRFKPRCIAIDREGKTFDLHWPTISRLTLDVRGISELRRAALAPSDQVKLRIHLSEAEKHEWKSIRAEATSICQEAGVELCGLELIVTKQRRRVVAGEAAAIMSPAASLYRFVEADDLGGELLDIGLECIES